MKHAINNMSSSLDSSKRNRNRSCGRWSLEGHFTDRTHYARLRCKAWRCAACGPRKANRVRRAILEVATQRQLSRFLTLTLNPRSCVATESVAYVKACWAKFRTYVKRRYRTSLSFIAVVELQKSGYAHLHVLIDRFIEQHWIAEAWQAVGGGQIVDIRHVDIHRIAPYMSKYLTKDLLLAPFKPRQRRYTTSRDFRLLSTTPSGQWNLLKVPIEFLFALKRQTSMEAVFDGHGSLQSFGLSSTEMKSADT